MRNQNSWVKGKLYWGLALLAGGVVVGVVGLALPGMLGELAFNPRLIQGLGIFLIGVGIAMLVQYASVRRNPQAARQMLVEKRDERSQMIRARSGNRAFWVSIALTYIILMWESFADDGSLPALSDDALWFFLAAAVLIPMVVYIGGIVYEQNNN
jgi:uncharacterized membrane protein YidH (DUF202 family)